ncbi:MAG: X2-like carbohydrate binding domain-containing protein, partial [Oscillospiraceae bacterium]
TVPIIVTAIPSQNSTISPTTTSFDKMTSAQNDVLVTLTLNGNKLSSIQNGLNMLTSGADYTVSDTMVTISKTYLATLSTGDTTLTFNFNAGSSQAMVVTVSDSTSIDECFIATAAFGSKFTWPVALLRHFRDQYLLTNSLGTAFVQFYYQNSPPIAHYIAGRESLKFAARVLLSPFIAVVYLTYHPVLASIILLILLAGFFLWRRKQLRVVCTIN